MSDMQLYLIALGASIIAAVIMFNWWQERRFSQDVIGRFDGPEDDALMGDFHADRDRPIAFDEDAIVLDEPFNARHEYPEPEPEAELKPEPEPEPEAEPVEPHLKDIPEDTLLSELPGVAREEALAEDAPKVEEGARQPNFDSIPFDEDLLPALKFSAAIDLPPSIDEKIDLVALIHFKAPMMDALLYETLRSLPRLDKATQWLGQDDFGVWRVLTKIQEVSRFNFMVCALQLSDRSGALSRESLRKFQLMIDALAEALGATLEWRGTNDPLRYADELDQFCIGVDVMVGFHLMNGSNGPFAATKLRGIAEAGGMQLHEDGTFHYASDNGDTLFTLQNHDQRPFTPELLRTAFIGGVSFQMDVPRVRNCPEAFNQMVGLARKMESSLGGILKDDKQHPLNTESMDKIRDQLRIINAKMLERGIIPGSPTALRLFS